LEIEDIQNREPETWNVKSRAALSEGLELTERLCTKVVVKMKENGTGKSDLLGF